jgi:UDP-N-acetylglucosamine--N-acetylmuramyl-(pentapeptide) pyrophosphoryl-undecaprenol N-acetylglucosamine transferase
VGSYRFILSGGGTGGHIYPAIAIANELKKRFPEAEFLFVGAKDRMEMEKVPQAGYKIIGLWISGFQRKLTVKNLLFPLKLISSLIKARSIVSQFKPHVVIGTGGFASGPLLKMASQKRIPCILQEQNSYAGITNKLLASRVAKICVAYDGMDKFFPSQKVIKTGNPVRSSLIGLNNHSPESFSFFELDSAKKTLLVLGGSLGARKINELIESQLGFFDRLGFQLIWQCGKLYYEEYKQYSSQSVKVYGYLNQTKNAQALVIKEAALMINEKELDTKFEQVFTEVCEDKETLQRLGHNIQKLAMPEATIKIVDEVVKLIPVPHES